jgi:hypothetical protein
MCIGIRASEKQDDPLQNLLYCCHEVLFCRSQQKPGKWGALLGELDHVTEIYRTLEAVKEATK